MQGIVVLIVYAALMLGATAILTKRSRSAEDFHVADRNLGTIVSAMSIAATWIWAPAPLHWRSHAGRRRRYEPRKKAEHQE